MPCSSRIDTVAASTLNIEIGGRSGSSASAAARGSPAGVALGPQHSRRQQRAQHGEGSLRPFAGPSRRALVRVNSLAAPLSPQSAPAATHRPGRARSGWRSQAGHPWRENVRVHRSRRCQHDDRKAHHYSQG